MAQVNLAEHLRQQWILAEHLRQLWDNYGMDKLRITWFYTITKPFYKTIF